MGELGSRARRIVEDHRDDLINRLLDYLRQPSISATGEGFPEATERAAAELRAAGLVVEVLPTPGRPAVFGEVAGSAASRVPTVLIYGHYDVQPPGPRELWASEPFAPEVRDGRIYARGAGDNKGQHFAHLQALRLLTDEWDGPPGRVKVLLDGEEEVGSPHLDALVAAESERLQADLVIWSDGPVHDSGRWAVVHGVRGVVRIHLRATGAGRTLHSGNFGNLAPQPAWTLIHALASLRSSDGRVLVEGFADDVEPLAAADRAALANLWADEAQILADIGAVGFDPILPDAGVGERLAARPTLTVNGFHTGDLVKTIIPNKAEAVLDIRLVSGQDPATSFRRVADHLARFAPGVEVTMGGAMAPSRTPVDNPYTPVLAQALVAATGEEPVLIPALGGSLPDYVWTRTLGVPSLGIPFANIDEANHAPNENLRVNCYLAGVAISLTVLLALGSVTVR